MSVGAAFVLIAGSKWTVETGHAAGATKQRASHFRMNSHGMCQMRGSSRTHSEHPSKEDVCEELEHQDTHHCLIAFLRGDFLSILSFESHVGLKNHLSIDDLACLSVAQEAIKQEWNS